MLSKKIILSTLLVSMSGLVACGDDSSSGSDGTLPEKVYSIEAVKSLNCNESVKCTKVFVEDGMVDDYFQCDGSQWFPATDTKFKELCPTKGKDENNKPESSSEASNKEGVGSSDSNGGSSDSGEISEEDKKQAALVAELGTCTESCDKKIDTTEANEVYICEWKSDAGLWRKLTSAELDSIAAEANKAAGEDFLNQNRLAEGVITTESGLQYKMLHEGSGALPTDNDIVKIRYTEKLLDDTTIEDGEMKTSSIDSFIPGIIELLKLMNTGSVVAAWIPSDLAYGKDGVPPMIPAYSVLVIEIELMGVQQAQ